MLRTGEAVHPAQPVPVIYVESKWYQPAGVFRSPLELRQTVVGGRTAVATLRGVKLEQYVALGSALRHTNRRRRYLHGRDKTKAGKQDA